MKTTKDNDLWIMWCSRPSIPEDERMRLECTDTILTAYAKEHPSYLATDADIKEWVLMPKTTSDIIIELQPVMHLEQLDVVMWLRGYGYPLVPGSSGLLEWAMYERRIIDD
ncbi:hypothetical protein [Hoylesella buccalis]|uniref:Uncharacterized protein n=1 Tax=Hoylesella buccalis DNF00853 TaxID=1401074 RepID=A0A095ZMD5_9BACT|nr:hypothetical protein [Hoylesella buccalis]KGF35798.1 hypothetical protein HMPREF2137_03655 [Hoylesella buccalis DNF00853]